MPDNPCDGLPIPARHYCQSDGSGPPGGGGSDGLTPGGGNGLTGGASEHVKELADFLIKQIEGFLAPDTVWAPKDAESALYQPFLWLGQHLAVSIFMCVVVVCALTAWQGAPRMRQLGASTGWTLAAVAGMASVPAAVMLLNQALSAAFKTAFNSDEATLFATIRRDLETGADANPVGILIIVSALVVALAFAALVFMTRQPAIVVFVCMAPLVLASLARGGDTTAVRRWAMRLLGVMFAPFALLLIAPFVKGFGGALVMDAVLLVLADALMLRMIFHGIPYFGPRIAGAARTLVERQTTNPVARGVVRAGAPDVYEQENTPRGPRTVDTPGRGMSQDGGVLLAAYGVKGRSRPGRLTTASAMARVAHDTERTEQIRQARGQARAAIRPAAPNSPAPTATNPRGARTPNPRPAPPSGSSNP
ncbi:hypothetical protein [Streptomyces antimicrobicus]|uniref:Integral membrane protein n=1 Tax=Streptomyces antimicrobicus TaxID=2883108 RepID=A0ABS8BBD9_9ACTN|nr:hypothetical protein [Streptomyces antimicrobicus]MCB5181878.1 hypothetical protein [Streptomyces antimicrobicus]